MTESTGNLSRKKRTHRTEAQWRELIQEYSQSGLTQQVFCRRHGLTPSSFHMWRKRFGNDNDTPKPSFIQLTPQGDKSDFSAHTLDQKQWAVELVLTSGHVLRIREV